ncbi:MAG: type II secretion system protein GspG, partial [Planctomycetota bacterium]
RLDGISLRRFPWDDLYGRMQRQLAEEKKFFAEKVDRARQTITELDAAIRRFREDTGQYPGDLGELLKRPRRFRSAAGDWPYVAETPTDPWEQRYRYEHPGKFNPDSFDVYSVHGNSRNPSLWIGNWPNPFHIRGALEGEQLKIKTGSEDVSTSKQRIGIASFPPLSGGQLLFIRLRQRGDSIDLVLPSSLKPGRYTMKVRLVTSWDYAIIRMSLNGAALGQPVDTYTPVIDTKSVVLGTVDMNSKVNTLSLEAVARNPESTGYYAGIDAVMLEPAQ